MALQRHGTKLPTYASEVNTVIAAANHVRILFVGAMPQIGHVENFFLGLVWACGLPHGVLPSSCTVLKLCPQKAIVYPGFSVARNPAIMSVCIPGTAPADALMMMVRTE